MYREILTLTFAAIFLTGSAVVQAEDVGNIEQTGEQNLAQILQVSSESGSNTASITQDGHKDWAAIAQFMSQESRATINQGDGDTNNWALILQPFGNDNRASIDQSGQNNYALTLQTGTSLQSPSSGNRATMEQVGNNNGHVEQGCCSNPCSIGPSCDEYWPLCKWAGEWKEGLLEFCCSQQDTRCFTQRQIGNANEAHTKIYGNRNQTAQWQEGDSNFADIDILGDGNCVKQLQFSEGNWAKVMITEGNNNAICTYQYDGHKSTICVTGNNNVAAVYGSIILCP